MNANPNDSELAADILLDMEATPQEVAAVEEVARKAGMQGSVRATYFRKSVGELPWIIFILVPVVIFCTEFMKGFAQEAGRNTYQSLKELITRLRAVRGNKDGTIVVRDADTFTHITFHEDLPEEAYKQLAQMEPEELKGGSWAWDSEQNQWIGG